MDKPLNNFGDSDQPVFDEWLLDSEIDLLDPDLDMEELRDNHPELASQLEAHLQETGYE